MLLRAGRDIAIIRAPFGQLAQLVEQRIENPRVRGSIPRLATKKNKQIASVLDRGFLLSRVRVATV